MPLCPALGVYAAIQMDPLAMVAHLDERAAEEAREIRPKTYLILTAFVCFVCACAVKLHRSCNLSVLVIAIPRPDPVVRLPRTPSGPLAPCSRPEAGLRIRHVRPHLPQRDAPRWSCPDPPELGVPV